MLKAEQGRHSTKTIMLFILLAISLSTIALIAYANEAKMIVIREKREEFG